ncbi:MAG TPA: hypothetical protein VIQ81_11350 [Gammaproteobacteria bacterium]
MSGLVFPLYHILRNDGVIPAMKRMENNQWKSQAELKDIQAQKLRILIEHCHENVPYYRELFNREAVFFGDNFLAAFNKIPPLTKQLVNANRARLMADNVSSVDLVENSTGGSTGESMRFYNDRNSLVERQAVVLRNQKWVGASYSDKEVRLWGAQMDLNKASGLRSKIHGLLNNIVHLSTYDLSDDSMQSYVDIINRYKPKLLISYPSPLAAFSRYITSNNINIYPVKSIITSAEKLYDWHRIAIQQAFPDSEIFDRYGCREFGNIAHECNKHEGYHVNDERFFLEILNDKFQQVNEGEVGKLYITDLDNYGFPFVRYEIGDLASFTSKTCSCGRGLSLLSSIEGRSFDVIMCPNGNRVAGTFWTICLRRYDGVVRFQVVQENLETVRLKLITDNSYKDSFESLIKSDIYDKCGKLNIIFDYVETIELTKSGKEKLVISNVQEK